MVIFGAHAFVKYANNLYTPKILGLKMKNNTLFWKYTNISKINRKQSRCTKRPNRRNRLVPTFYTAMDEKFRFSIRSGRSSFPKGMATVRGVEKKSRGKRSRKVTKSMIKIKSVQNKM